MRSVLFRSIILLSLLLFISFQTMAVEWPQEVTTSEGTIVVYQPQPETLSGNQLTARSAMSFQIAGQDEVFGVFWFSATVDTDRASDTATVRDIKVTQVRWPESKDAGEQRFTSAVNAAIKSSQFDTSLSQLTASLESAEAAEQSLKELKTDPPEIIFETELAVLLSFDGSPKFQAIDNSPYERALNTPLAVIKEASKDNYYLTSGNFWYQASKAIGPYHTINNPPADLVKMMPKDDSQSAGPTKAPKIVVATEPTELIATDGTPKWKSLTGGELMYVNNTETPWLRELKTSNMYIMLSGRWYRAKKQTGPWTFVRADELPQSFANIPPESDLGGLRVSVAGTEEAEEAMLDAKVPQTAAISRKDTSLSVTYDGEPKFKQIPGTEVAYAVNTAAQVLLIDKIYYAVDNAVWFKADSAKGPWLVADKIPKDQIAKIPPSSPVYNVTYVDIYESTPEVVYVGYYPGYMWSYPYYGAPVYGTGWYYPPYWGGMYYPRPPTWGFNVNYNPWTGWSFGLSWSNGFFSFGVGWNTGFGPYGPGHCCGGWYGGGYRGPVVINTGDINIGNKVNIGNHNNININHNNIRNNIYKRKDNIGRNASTGQIKRNLKTAKPNTAIKNNVFADKQGNVLKNNNGQWQQRAQGQWQNLDANKQQQIKNKASNIDRNAIRNKANNHDFNSTRMQQLNNANRARMQGMQRQQMRRTMPANIPRRGR